MRKLNLVLLAGLCAGPLCAIAAGTDGPTAQAAAVMDRPALAASAVPDAASASPDPANFAAMAARCAPSIHVRTLSSLVRQESRLNPYAININGSAKLPRQPATAAEGIATAQSLLDQGYNIDVGLGQINSNNFQWLGLSLVQLFDPCENLRAAARVLSNCYTRGVAVSGEGQGALHAALSCYNTGSLSNGIKNGYVRNVLAQANLPVPELLPLAPGAAVSAPVSLRAHRAAEGPTPPGAETSVPAKVKGAGEPDVFTASADDDAFSAQPAKGEDTDSHQN